MKHSFILFQHHSFLFSRRQEKDPGSLEDEDLLDTFTMSLKPTLSSTRFLPGLVPLSLNPELRALLQGILKSGVVKESSSPWAAPVVLVKRQNGSWGFCVNDRKLNMVPHKDAYPLTCIEESLTRLQKA